MKNVKIEYNEMKYLFDPNLGLKAKGIMALCIAYINSHGASETFKLGEVMEMCADGISAFQAALRELEMHGYVEKYMGRGERKTTWYFTFRE